MLTPTPPQRLQPSASYSTILFRDISISHAPDSCVVITGAGKSFFSGFGLNIGFPRTASGEEKVVQLKDEHITEHRDSGGRAVLAIHQCSKPTIAAINSAAVGIGIIMCLPAVIRVAYEKANIGFVSSRRGLVMEACSSYFLPCLISFSRAMLLTTIGAVYPANSPHFGSLFAEILPTPEATLARTLEMADDIAKNTSTVSNRLMRNMMYCGPDSAEASHLPDSRVIYSFYGSKDNIEGVQSFFEKRPARFTGTLSEDTPEGYPWWNPVDIGLATGQTPR
ncbi:enoyl-CoA hydratase/isomerase [Bipolaris maydis]|nr:enoyl-CoA hydratase/isomerase [Bipolaris maydis]